MKRFIKTALTAVLVVAAVACTRESVPQKENINGTIDISFTGVINGYTPQDETKAEAQTVVRIMWKGGETVYVFDGTKNLGFLTASIEGTDGTYAKLSGTIDGTQATTLTFVYSPQFDASPAVTDGKISLDLSLQEDEDVPFLIYATLPTAQAPATFSNDVVQFNLATSVFKCNCAGLGKDESISKAEINGLNTKCELTLSNSGAPEVSGSTPGTITHTKGFTKADQRAIFSVALAKTAASTERRLLVHQNSKVFGASFLTIDFAENKSYNTVFALGEYEVNESGDYAPKAPEVPVESISLSKTELELMEGGSESLTVTFTPENATQKAVFWSSDNTAVATVDQSGKVSAVSVGTATITAVADGLVSDACTVTVVVPVTGVTLNKAETTLAAGGTETLTATVAPDNATNKNVTWSSDKETVATVDKDGKVTAIASGTATITVTTEDGGKTATCAVTVTVPVTGVSLNKSSISIAVGKDETLTATVNPTNATNKKVTWSSNNTAVATVDKDGKVTAVAAGTATITVTTADGSKTATCTVTVIPKGFVDLGLPSGLKWGACNLGANSPEEYGKFFQWGDITGHVCNGTAKGSIFEGNYNFQWSNAPFHNGSSERTDWTKYIPSNESSYWQGGGSPDNKTTLDDEDDAAQKANMGRMPAPEDFVELFKECYAEWGTYKNVIGLIVYKAKSSEDKGHAYRQNTMYKYSGSGDNWSSVQKPRPNYNTSTDTFVFFPAAGYGPNASLCDPGISGNYWSSSLYTDNPCRAYCLVVLENYNFHPQSNRVRYYGFSIRPVID